MNSRRRAFTLIELLVVISVIAVLMAILMPALQRAKEQGQAAACQGNLKGFTLALQMYAQEHEDGFPEPRSCYFRSGITMPGDVSDHRRWCNEDVNLRYHPEYGSEFYGYLSNVRSLIRPRWPWRYRVVKLTLPGSHYLRPISLPCKVRPVSRQKCLAAHLFVILFGIPGPLHMTIRMSVLVSPCCSTVRN